MSIMRTLTINGTTYNVTPVVPASSVTLLSGAWVGDGDAYSQVVELPGVTPNTKVDLQPTADQLAEFYYKVLAFVAENDGGVVRVYAVGDKPKGDHTIQTTLTEVETTGKIRGNTVGTPMPRSNFNQTDPNKADYIVGRDKIVQTINGVPPDESGNVVVQGGGGGSGEAGADGFSPVANVTQTASGAVISITDKSGTTTATIVNGKDGADGKDGKDGAQGIQGEQGPKGDTGAPGADGAKGDKGDKGDTGAQGNPGKDGVSATHSWNGTTLTITSASGTSSANLKGEKGDKGDKGDQGIQGEKGDTGAAGSNGTNGTSVTVKSVSESTADGGSNVVTFSDGKTLTVKNGSKGSKGDKGDKGDTGADGQPGVPGADGNDGHTPVRGVDYWTSADKAEIEAYLATELAKRGQLMPEYADSIEKCTDTSKLYVLPDGMIYAWMLTEKEVSSGGGYTNALDGVTININKRWSHSSKGLSSANGYATMTVPVTADKKVYVNVPRVAFLGNYPRIHYMDASNNYVTTLDRLAANAQVLSTKDGVTSWTTGYQCATAGDASTNARLPNADSMTKMVLVLNMYDVAQGTDGAASTTLGAITEADVANLIVSVGNPIEEGGTTIVKEYAWASTGHAFVPADYEDRIVAVEKTATNNTARIVALEKSVESGGADDSEKAALDKIQKWDKPVYDPAPVTLIADNRAKPALTTNDRTISAIYAKYRALMAAHPDYITETNMGKSSASSTFTAVDMLRFDFKEPDGLTQPDLGESARHETKPTLIFLSGIHTEWAGVWGLYYALEEITTNPDFDDVRRNAHIVVIPCANPFTLTSQTAVDGWRMSHVNANGVAIHNNFGVNHSTSGAVGEYNYGGSAPYSEPETQYIDAVMAEYPDAVAFVSCHNNDYSTYYGSHVIWASSATYHMCNVAFRLVDKLTKAWLDKYGDTLRNAIDQYKINMDANDYRLGRATMSTSKGTEQLNATKYGIMGVNLEISRMMKVFSGNTDGTSEVMTHGAEVYANFMRTLLWNYDHKDKKEYAPNLPWSE